MNDRFRREIWVIARQGFNKVTGGGHLPSGGAVTSAVKSVVRVSNSRNLVLLAIESSE